MWADALDGGSMRWYLNRLRCMSPAEIPHRLVRAVRAQVEARALARRPRPEPRLDRPGATFVTCRPQVDAESSIAAAERILGGRVPLFAVHEVDAGRVPAWNRDPKTGIDAPTGFGKQVDYRNAGEVGDIKFLWELNRHAHLVSLAEAARLSGKRRYGEALRVQLEAFFHDCPCPRGVNWSSALEPAMRLLNWSLAWQLLGGAEARLFDGRSGRGFRTRWLEAIYDHMRFVRGWYSRHSSANNHLVGEAAGVLVAAATWPYWPETARWGARARKILEREVLAQNAPDGVNREQALSYLQFEYDLLLLARLAGQASGQPFSTAFTMRMRRMARFLASVMDVAGNVPMIGDSDDGVVTRLGTSGRYCRYRSVLATAALLDDRPGLARKAGYVDDKTRWLLGDVLAARFDELKGKEGDHDAPPGRRFPDGGYYVLGSDFESQREIRLIVDAGPLGYKGIAAHGHADALSFTLSVGGRELFVDPGTYAYHADDRWRAYFRGTSAHNTLRVDGLDQSEPGGNFMWLRKARARCHRFDTGREADRFEGSHDGYRRLRDPVTHTRHVTLEHRRRCVTIEDRLAMAGRHDIELFFHLGEKCRVEPTAAGFAVHRDGYTAQLALPKFQGAKVEICRGRHDPPLGWISRHYDERRPTTTIAWRARIDGDASLATRFLL